MGHVSLDKRDLFFANVDDEYSVRLFHQAHEPAEVLGHLFDLARKIRLFFLCIFLELAFFFLGLEVDKDIDTSLDLREVRQSSADPAVLYEWHIYRLGGEFD